jgi:hypothetical protein
MSGISALGFAGAKDISPPLSFGLPHSAGYENENPYWILMYVFKPVVGTVDGTRRFIFPVDHFAFSYT